MQLRADVNYLNLDLELNVERLPTLELEIRWQHSISDRQPGHHFQQPSSPCGVENVKPPSEVPTFLLSAVNISLSFSFLGTTALVPRKRTRSEPETYLDLFNDPVITRNGKFSFDHGARESNHLNGEQCSVSQVSISAVPLHIHKDTNEARSMVFKPESEEEEFIDLLGSTAGDDCEDNESHVFSSQASTLLPSQEASSKVTSEPEFPLQASSINSLVDACFRNLICLKPIRTAPGITTETSDLEVRLADIAPSIFSPGYAGKVAARAPLVPTIARFLTSFLSKGSNPSISAEKDLLLQQFSGIQCAEHLDGLAGEEDEEIRLKEVVKKHVWTTMTNGLRDPGASRRLRPLQPFLRPDAVQPGHLLDLEDVACEEAESGKMFSNGMPEDDHGTGGGPKIDAASSDDEILDFDEDDEENDDESSLFEALEERLRNAVDPGESCGFEPWPDADNNMTTHPSASDDLSPSPMLEEQVEAPQPKHNEQPPTTLAPRVLNTRPAVLLKAAHASTDSGNDETRSNLPDEEDPSAFGATAKNQIAPEPSSLSTLR